MQPANHDILAHLRLRDRRSLILFAIISVLLVGAGEWAAFHLDMVQLYGIEPVLIRAFVYILLAVLLWAYLLRSDRQKIESLLHRNEEYFRSLIFAYEEALGLKDWYSGGHGRRTARYSVVIAGLLKLSPIQIQQIEYAALLHDIGKIGVPDTILTKAGKLTNEEWKIMQNHAAAGAELVEKIGILQDLAPSIRGHHERINGQGYPDELSGDEIPLGARIIAIADTLDAVTTSRSYRSAASFDKALIELDQSAGTHFDSALITTILSSHGRAVLEMAFRLLTESDT